MKCRTCVLEKKRFCKTWRFPCCDKIDGFYHIVLAGRQLARHAKVNDLKFSFERWGWGWGYCTRQLDMIECFHWARSTIVCDTHLQGVFLLVRPIFSTKMKNELQPTRTTLSRNFQCKKASRWLSKFFHFGTENREEQLKKHPVYSIIYICILHIIYNI